MIVFVLAWGSGFLLAWGWQGIVLRRRFRRALTDLRDDQRQRGDVILGAEAAERIANELWR